MKTSSELDAIALFGSCARGDRDSMSDRDILILSDNKSIRRSETLRLRRKGWSPVAFSWRRLERAGAQKRLFIQHLKLESRVLWDRNGRFREYLTKFAPSQEYRAEKASSHTLIGILESIPNSKIGRYWALDVLAVGLRSLGVATLANHGVYRFSGDGILLGLRDIGILRAGDVDA
ncbi:MAG: hypothetical protein QOD99_3224, partial [Chthoniobacter sp.]|nr:hypothetical protein [Chthoniobacter sp.]